MLTFSEAEIMMRRARNGSRRLQNNTYLYPSGPDAYAVRLHGTNVVTVNRDGTYTLRTGGWDTPTTKTRISGYSPARVSSEGGTWAVWHASDPKTAPKIQKCRSCRGTGVQHTQSWTETYGRLEVPAYEVKDEFAWNTVHEGLTYPELYHSASLGNSQPLMRDGQPLTDQPKHVTIAGQVTRHDTGSHWKLPVPVHHPSTPYQCHGCGGSGQRDYGSKTMPVLFFDGITVDSDGAVVGAENLARLREPAEITAARTKKATRRERAAWVKAHGLTVRAGEVRLYKAVRDDLVSANGATYAIGTTVTARDYAPTRECGQGLHFSPAVADARQYDGGATRFLACAVDYATMIILDDASAPKVKARSCRVLYEVNTAGTRLRPQREIQISDPGYRE